jgi:uncharacterized protein involved in outer membrane biogenesis
MRLERRHARIPAAIALVALAAFAVLWIGARTPLARGMVAGWIADAAGLPARIETLRLGFFPSPSVHIGGLEIAQPPGFGESPLLAVGRLELRIPWGSVFNASRVKLATASDATARLVVGADGVANWSKLGGEPARGVEPGKPPRRPAEPPSAPPAGWFLGALKLERGAIEFRDHAAKSHWQLRAIALDASDVAPGAEFPLELSFGGLFGSNTIHYAAKGRARLDPDAGRYEASALEFRGWAGGEPLPLAGAELTGALGRAAYESGTDVATLADGRFMLAGIPGTFDGRLELDEPGMAGAFRVTTEAFAPRAPAIVLGHPLPPTTDPEAFASLQVALEAALENGQLSLDPVSGQFDETRFEGRIVPAERLVRAHLDRIDLNRYLPPATDTPREKNATLEAAVAGLTQLDLDAEIRIDEARAAGARIRGLVVRVERNAEAGP